MPVKLAALPLPNGEFVLVLSSYPAAGPDRASENLQGAAEKMGAKGILVFTEEVVLG